ncbi:MAG: sigma-70 family RNA polymerase sigma factor [Salinivirgaceae bacterium]|nr:sigma-70 family RNA polymerase sigma factor [Salinivirgaceae bacterium]
MIQKANNDEQRRVSTIADLLNGGDRKAAAVEYAYFVKRYSQQVLDFTVRMVSNRADAEELAQNTFVKAFNRFETFEGRASFLTWVSRIAYNESINHLKRRKLRWIDVDDAQIADSRIDDDELSAGREERISLMEDALDCLPPDERMLVQLYYYEDKPLQEIAYVMDVEPNTLAVRLHRIRKKLLIMIKHKENEQV